MENIVEEIKKAIEKHELCAYYQPQYDAMTDRLVSAEALVRWIKGDGHIVPPMDFIPQLEETDAVTMVDWYMAEEVCKTLQELGPKAIPIAVNFSRWHVKEDDFSEHLTGLLEKYEVPSDLFEVEITESALVAEESAILPWIRNVRGVKIRVAIDDFGSGLSSLQFIKDMPIDILKIDKTFIDSAIADSSAGIITQAVVDMAGKLGLKTVAEGVETQAQQNFMNSIGCDYIQGYLTGKPMSKMDFEKLIIRQLP